MRALGAALAWLLTTILLTVGIPAIWAAQHLVDRGGYAALSRTAAASPELQAAAAQELTAQARRLGYTADPVVVAGVAAAYTGSPSFPAQFAAANALAHRWLFDGAPEPSGGPAIDFAPLLSDPAFAQTLRDMGAGDVVLPATLPVPVSDTAPSLLRPEALRQVAVWSPGVSVALVALTAASALLTLFLIPNRGKAVAVLGVSALLAGAVGWVSAAWVEARTADALSGASADMRRIVEVMVTTATDSAHRWLIVTVIVGAGLVAVGVVVSLLAGLASAGRKASGAKTNSTARP